MDQSPTVNNSPTAAKQSAVPVGGVSGNGRSDVNQTVKRWPKGASAAKTELDSILKRLTERVQYITGATGAALGLLEGTDMVCRATSGTTAPDLGVHLETWKGLSGECVRSGETLRCDNVEFDARVDVESCRRMGVQSIVVTPLRRNNVLVGIFELFSSQPYAFQDRDVATLQRTAELVNKELERRPLVVDASYVRLPESLVQSAANERIQRAAAEASSDVADLAASVTSAEQPAESAPQVATIPCRNCGAPVEEGRLLCTECGSLQADPEALGLTRDEEPPVAVAEVAAERDPFAFVRRIRIPRYSVGAILAMLALFVAFLPTHTNQVDAQSNSSVTQTQEQPPAPVINVSSPAEQSAAQTPVSVTPQPTVPGSTVNPSVNAPVPIPNSTSASPAATTQSASAGQQFADATPPPPSPQTNQVAPVIPIAGRTYSQAPAPPITTAQVPVAPAAQSGSAPVAGTPHAGPVAQPENPLDQPRYEPAQRAAHNRQNEPWFIARVNNAIDSFQQMFQPPPDPGPTAEQLGDPRVVVWVDLTTGLYYCPGASTYGKTDKGKFLTQKEAQAEYFTSAIRIGCK